LNSSAMPTHDVFGGQSSQNGSSLIGGVPIGGSLVGAGGTVGSSNKNDIALLQSLLPGVHITSGTDAFSTSIGWSGGSTGVMHQSPVSSGSGDFLTGSNWNSGFATAPGPAVGAVGKNAVPQNQRRQPGIW
jgi:hypothetical protein